MSIASNIRAGSAYVEVTADTGRLSKGLSQAQAQLRAFGQTCTNVGRDLLVLSANIESVSCELTDFKCSAT